MMTLKHLGLIAAGLVAPTVAGAQCRLCEKPTTTAAVDSPNGDVQLQIETNLNFDRTVVSGAGNGAATIRPDGSNSIEGSVNLARERRWGRSSSAAIPTALCASICRGGFSFSH